jgi:hypothetical protein
MGLLLDQQTDRSAFRRASKHQLYLVRKRALVAFPSGTVGMANGAKNGNSLTEEEVQGVVTSIQNISPIENDAINLEERRRC